MLNYYISHPIKVFSCIHQVLDFPLICHTPSKFLSYPARLRHLRHLKLLKDSEFAALQCPFYNIGASTCPMAAFSVFYESHEPPPSGDARGIVLLHRDGYQNGQKSGYMLHYCCVDWCPGSCRGNTEQVVGRWLRPVASSEALLVMLHQAMHSVSHRCTAMAIGIVRNGVACVHRRRPFWLL